MKSSHWRVQADPEHAGKHPFHDNRFITCGEFDLREDSFLQDPDNYIVCTMRDCRNQKEHAQLIAAAPELLEACKMVLLNLDPDGDHPRHQHVLYSDCLGPENDDQTVVEYLKGVIAKAEGNA